jgi:hypothetical protein
LNHLAKVGIIHEIYAPVGSYTHLLGTLASNIELIDYKISGVIIIWPSIASHVSISVFLTILKTFCILATSCDKNIFNGTAKPTAPNALGPLSFLTSYLT